MLSIHDVKYLTEKKAQLIDKCRKCKGEDLTCICYHNYLIETEKVVSQIPIKYRHFTLQDIDATETKKNVDRIAKYINKLDKQRDKGKGLYLWGNCGSAKTALACIILTEAIKKGYKAYFTDLPKCMEYITSGWQDDSVKQSFVQKILNTDFLVIDDVGREYRTKTGFTETHFDLLFRERTNNLLPTILTSNLSLQDIGTDYGKRLLSIFYEHITPIEFTSGDYRRKVLSRK